MNPRVVLITSSDTALLTSTSILITNEYISKLKIRYTKLRDWINVITLLYQKTLTTPMVDKKNDEKAALELKNFYNQYFDKRKKI